MDTAHTAPHTADVIIVGGGHNGLVSGILLAERGLKVVILEAKDQVGGAVKTEYPFANAPRLPQSTGAYLLGLMPPELLAKLQVDIPYVIRDPHYFLPTTGERYLLFGQNDADLKDQFIRFFSQQDWEAHSALQQEISAIREDIAPTWFQEPLSIEDTADAFVRDELRQVFIDLCRQPISHYLARFDFRSDLVQAMYAVTDAFSGLNASWDTPGTGMNFLIHNMCRLPGGNGTWTVVQGGMGTITQTLARRFLELGGTIHTGTPVQSIESVNGSVSGVMLSSGDTLQAATVLVNADPFTMRELIGAQHLPQAYNDRLDNYRRTGTTLKLNLALKAPPRFRCLPESQQAFGPTIHLLPDEDVVIDQLRQGFAQTQQGQLPEFPTIEWYIHSTIDPTLTDPDGNLSSALFVQWVPYELADGTWEEREDAYADQLLSIADRFAPGTSDLVVDRQVLHPQKIESHFGIRYGHIHHIDNAFGFADRLPYTTPIAGVYSCSAGTHPAGSVIGCAGHNAAQRILQDLECKVAVPGMA